jgi:hypothetical protein
VNPVAQSLQDIMNYEDLKPYPFVEKPAAKSSTSVMKASVCQRWRLQAGRQNFGSPM